VVVHVKTVVGGNNTNMEEQNQGVNQAEQTANATPGVQQIPEHKVIESVAGPAPEVEEQGIPHGRVQEMVAKAKEKSADEARAELMAAYEARNQSQTQPKPKAQTKAQTEDDEALQIVNQMVEEKLQGHLSKLYAKQELNEALTQFPDLHEHSGSIAQKMQSSGISLADAYKAVKYEQSISNSQAQDLGKQQAYESMQRKQASTVERAGQVAQPQSRNVEGDINVWDRSIPLSEIEKLLPHS